MSDPGQDALARLRAAVKAAGGAVLVASRAGVPQTHLSTVTSGKRELGKVMFRRLRKVIRLPSDVWVELLANEAPMIVQASASESQPSEGA